MSTRKGTMRRGPTMRGRGGYRPPIGRQSIARRREDDEEEFMALNHSDNEVEMEQIEFGDEQKRRRNSGGGQPQYEHGAETFGDVISHPIEQYNAHRARRQTYKQTVESWRQRYTGLRLASAPEPAH